MFPAGRKVQGSTRYPHNLLRQSVLYTVNQWEMTFAKDESKCVIVLYVIDIVYTPETEGIRDEHCSSSGAKNHVTHP